MLKRRFLKIGLPLALLLLAFVAYRWYASAHDIRWVYIAPRLDSRSVSPLFPDTDARQLENLKTWMRTAKPIQDKTLAFDTSFKGGGPTVLVVQYRNGDTAKISTAYTCPPASNCSVAKNKVAIQKPNGEPYFAESPELYKMLWLADRNHPNVQPMAAPDIAPIGLPFKVEGNEWLTDNVTVSLKKDNQTVWSGQATPLHGHFSLTITTPTNLESGKYKLEYKSKDWINSWATQGLDINLVDTNLIK